MDNQRIRTALLALFFGNIGLDMLSLESHQQKLFLLLGGPLLAAVIGGMILAFTHNPGWIIIAAAAAVLLELWSIARFFEALSHTDESFDRLLAESNDPAFQAVPVSAR